MNKELSDAELGITLSEVILVLEDGGEEFDDNYMRRMRCAVWLEDENSQKTPIGNVELIYFDGCRAVDNRFDIVEIADWVGDNEWEIAQAMYTKGLLSQELYDEVTSNDLLAVDSISIQSEYRGRNYELRIVRKLTDAIGRRCGAIVIRSDVLTEAGIASKSSNVPSLQPTKNPGIYRIERIWT